MHPKFSISFLILHFLFISAMLSAASVDTVEINSVAMRKTSRCIVIKPETYNIHSDAYPVLYLLHGWSGSYAGWLSEAPQLTDMADRFRMLIVCPDGGYDSWYLDSPVDSTVRYDTYISREVVDYIDYYYHTRREPAGRAISGLSMGGHGAISLTIRHPETFGAVGSMCGGLDLRPFKKNDWDLQGVLGSPMTRWENWEKNSVINLLPALKNRKIPMILDCGLGDFFLPVNRAVHQRLLELGIPHEYTERPGEHNSAYWSNAVDYQIVFFDKFFNRK
ncbi:MAG: hypothetical protein IT269_07090 [Saprospiraceae bacterium]|nr:hypothetical protein [Saprospiraceae bacterium]